MAAVWAAGPEPMMATFVWGGWGFMVVVGKGGWWCWGFVVMGGEEEEEEEWGEVVVLAVGCCWEAVEAARVKGRPERREV